MYCVYSASGATVHNIVLLLRCSVVGGVNSLLNMLHCSLVPGNRVDHPWLELVSQRQRMNPCRFGISTQHFVLFFSAWQQGWSSLVLVLTLAMLFHPSVPGSGVSPLTPHWLWCGGWIHVGSGVNTGYVVSSLSAWQQGQVSWTVRWRVHRCGHWRVPSRKTWTASGTSWENSVWSTSMSTPRG